MSTKDLYNLTYVNHEYIICDFNNPLLTHISNDSKIFMEHSVNNQKHIETTALHACLIVYLKQITRIRIIGTMT